MSAKQMIVIGHCWYDFSIAFFCGVPVCPLIIVWILSLALSMQNHITPAHLNSQLHGKASLYKRENST